MATDFPGNLDNFTNPANGDKLDSPSHSEQHSDANDAITEIETKLGVGVSPAGSAVAGYALVHSTGGTTAWSPIVSVDGGSVIEPSDADLEGLIIQGATPEIATIGTATATAGTITYEGTNTFTTGDEVKITGINPAQFNQHKATLSDATSTTFSVVGTAAGTYVSGGTAILYQGNLQEWKDYQGNVVASVNQFGESNLGGLVHIETASFSAVSAVNINDVFSSTYDNYKIFFELTTASINLVVSSRLRVSGADNTTSNYSYTAPGAVLGTTTANNIGDITTSFDDLSYAFSGAQDTHIILDVTRPNRSLRTGFMGQTLGANTAFAALAGRTYLGTFATTTVFTGISFLASTGNFTGSYSVYGYKKV